MLKILIACNDARKWFFKALNEKVEINLWKALELVKQQHTITSGSFNSFMLIAHLWHEEYFERKYSKMPIIVTHEQSLCASSHASKAAQKRKNITTDVLKQCLYDHIALVLVVTIHDIVTHEQSLCASSHASKAAQKRKNITTDVLKQCLYDHIALVLVVTIHGRERSRLSIFWSQF